MRLLLMCAAPLALAACNETPPVDPASSASAPAAVATTNAKVEPVPTEPAAKTSAAPDPAGASPCGADKAAAFIGRQDRPTTRADLAKAVGHDRIRWIGPGDVVTMDFSEERLNVMLDETGRVIREVKCG